MPLRVDDRMPSLDGIAVWLNGEVEDGSLMDHPVLLYFWSASCPACLYNMPTVQQWRITYAGTGLLTVAVHLPMAPCDRDLSVVREAVESHGITDPCAVDNDGILAGRFDTGEVWPYYFLFDAEGRLRSRAAGGMGLRLLEGALKRYFAAKGIEATASR